MITSSSSSVVALMLALAGPSLAPQDLWTAWPSSRFVTVPAPCLDHESLVKRLGDLQARHPEELRVEVLGRSVEGRSIHLLTLGKGPRRILFWSQMHGDEPSATPALLDLAHFLLSSSDPAATQILEGATLLLVPMLNPDGAERYERANAQGIDINRDALRLATPEGRLLKRVRARFEPELAFNLHDQDRRTMVGATGQLATLSLLAVAGDAAGTMSPGRARAQRVAAAIVRSLEAYIPGGIARYDEDWNPLAFGDNVTAWGTPVVLIESGGLPPGWRHTDLTRLNFVGLLAALSGLVENDLADEDPGRYKGLARNSNGAHVDVVVSGGRVWQPGAGPPYEADVGFDRLDPDPVEAGCVHRAGPGPSKIVAVGDGQLLGGGHRVNAVGRLVAPTLSVSVRGWEAQEWLVGETLAALGRLGVGRVRWHVTAPRREEARRVVVEGPGLPDVEVARPDAEVCGLVIEGPPATPETNRLDAVLDALTESGWRSRLGDASDHEILEALTTCGSGGGPVVSRDRPASLLLLRPSPEVPPASGPVSVAAPPSVSMAPEALVLERVFIDGREPPAERP